MLNLTGKTKTHLNLRTGPGAQYSKLRVLPPDTPLLILSKQGSWLHVLAETRPGFVHGDYVQVDSLSVSPGFIEIEDFASAELHVSSNSPEPPEREKISLGSLETNDEKSIAKTWNRVGGLLSTLASKLKIEPGLAVAVLIAEAGGQAFSAGGRMIIRFENHIFFDRWGWRHPQIFQKHFKYNPDRRWQAHMWRPASHQPWLNFHGRQATEWQVFEFARSLDDTAAKLAISMGSPQIMGFNYTLIGYESVQHMFEAFSQSESQQIVGLFNLIKGPNTHSRMLEALQSGNLHRFAELYNGRGQAGRYADIIRNLYDTFQRVKGESHNEHDAVLRVIRSSRTELG